MNDFCVGLFEALLRSGLVLSVSSLCLALFFRVFPVASSRLRRVVWFAVILQGVLLFRIPVTIPLSNLVSSNNPQAAFDPDAADHSRVMPRLATEFTTAFLTTDFVSASVAATRLTSTSGFPWATIFALLWGIGIIAFVGRSIWNYFQFIRQLPVATEVPQEWIDEWNSLQRNTGRRHKLTLCPTSHLGPLLCWSPRGYQLIVPADVWRLLESRQRIMILRHELAHLERHDIWKSLLLHLLALPHWYNPLVWWTVKQFDDDAELACDDAVSQSGSSQAINYARTLLLLGGPNSATYLTTQAVGGHGLADRIRRLIVPNPRKDSNMKKMAIVTFVVGISTLHLLRFQSQAEEKSVTVVVGQAADGITLEGTTLQISNVTLNSAQLKRTEAVVDVRQLLDKLEESRHELEKLKAFVGEQEEAAKALESASQKEIRIAGEGGKNESEINSKSREFAIKLENLRLECYRKLHEMNLSLSNKITKEVATYAKENGIRVVRRAQRSKNTTFSSSISGTAVPQVTTNVQINLTNVESFGSSYGVNTTKSEPTTKESPSTTGSFRAESLTLIANAEVPNTAQDSVLVTTSEPGLGVISTSFTPPPSDPKGVTVYMAHGKPLFQFTIPIQQAGGSTATRYDRIIPMEPMQWADQKEVIYAEPGDEFDITAEILKRMNDKFEKEPATKSSK